MKRLLKTVLALLLVALALEVMARALSTVPGSGPPEPGWRVSSETVGWTRRAGFEGNISCGVQGRFDHLGFRSVDSAQVADPQGKTIAFLGDSNTYGYCVDTNETFVEVVDRLLPHGDAINLGVNGYTSYQGYETLLELGALLEPAIIVASFNFNDRRYVLDASAVDSGEAFRAAARNESREAVRQALRTSFFVRALDVLIRRTGIVASGEPSLQPVDVHELQPRVDPEAYRQNLTGIAEWARARGSRVLFLLLGDNPVMTGPIEDGIESIERGDYETAIDQLRIAMRNPTFTFLARIHLARAFALAGMPEEAREVTRVRPLWSLTGGGPVHLDKTYHDVVRDVAARFEIEVIDAGSVLDQTPGDYIDFGHFDERGHQKVAELLHEPLQRLLRGGN
jgi:lysophospholipase L1-like esterase